MIKTPSDEVTALFKYIDKSPLFIPGEKQSNSITWALHPIFKHLRKTREIQKKDMKSRDTQIPTFPETCCDNEQYPLKTTPQHTTDQQFTSTKPQNTLQYTAGVTPNNYDSQQQACGDG